MMHEPTVRYSDADLQEFKTLIDEKIVKAQEELEFSQRQITELNESGFNQQGGDWYDDTSSHADLEMLQRTVLRLQKHIQDLKNALLRIQNKTYGVCIVTGQLIDKQRLRAVPHATKSVDGKNLSNSGRDVLDEETPTATNFGGDENGKSAGRPIGDKLRMPNVNRPTKSADDWEPTDETLEDAGYRRRKEDEE